MRNDDLGCTDKCKARNKLVESELDRNQAIVQVLMQF
jgi:hypothetical protein